jgi:hypothetical protein
MPTTNSTFIKSLNLTAILDEAFAAAGKTAQDWLDKHGDRDACGFAWVNIKPARGPFYDAVKNHPLGGRHVHKNYGDSGVQLWNPSQNHTQSISPKEDGAAAFVAVLRKHGITKETTGISLSTGSRMD